MHLDTTQHLNFSTLCVVFRLMENEEGRKEYLVFPPSKSQCPTSSQKGRKIPLKGNGRRIDYILYSDEGLQQDWKLVRQLDVALKTQSHIFIVNLRLF